MLLSSVSEMMEWGVRGAPATRRVAVSWRVISLAAFFALWSLAGGLVEATRPFNPLFLPAPWVVIGALLELARKGQLWMHVAATLERVADGAELVTCIAGAGHPLPRERVEELLPAGVEIEYHEGDQPAWWWLLSGE